MSQEALAQLLHIDRSQISRWENGKLDISEEFWPLLKTNIGLNIEEESSKRESVNSEPVDIRRADKNQKTDVQILTFAMIEFLGYIIGPWGFIVCLFGLYYAFKKTLPLWVKVLGIFLMIHLFSGFLWFYFPSFFLTEVKIEDISYVLQRGILN